MSDRFKSSSKEKDCFILRQQLGKQPGGTEENCEEKQSEYPVSLYS
jgi:hypothetical protein